MGVRYREYIASGRRNQFRQVRINTGGRTNAIYIQEADLNRAFRDLERIAKHYKDQTWRKETMQNAAQFVAVAAQKRQTKSDGVHYYYKNRTKGKRRARGTAISDRVKIRPGNLRLSIQFLDKLKKTPFAVIGPKIKKRLGNLKNLGKSPANSSGFYAWMADKSYTGADDFRRAVMEPALTQTAPKVIAYVERKTAQHTDKVRNQLSIFE